MNRNRSKKMISMKLETAKGLSSCSNFPEIPTDTKFASNKQVLDRAPQRQNFGQRTGLPQGSDELERRRFFETQCRHRLLQLFGT